MFSFHYPILVVIIIIIVVIVIIIIIAIIIIWVVVYLVFQGFPLIHLKWTLVCSLRLSYPHDLF